MDRQHMGILQLEQFLYNREHKTNREQRIRKGKMSLWN